MTSDIITIGRYEVHSGASGGFSVVNPDTGEVISQHGTSGEAVATAHAVNMARAGRSATTYGTGQAHIELREDGPQIEDAEERQRVHDLLAREGGCCCYSDCWQPVYCGSVCASHAREERAKRQRLHPINRLAAEILARLWEVDVDSLCVGGPDAHPVIYCDVDVDYEWGCLPEDVGRKWNEDRGLWEGPGCNLPIVE